MSALDDFNVESVKKLECFYTNEELVELIKYAARESSCHYIRLSVEQVKWLEEKGFKVEGRDSGANHRISWE